MIKKREGPGPPACFVPDCDYYNKVLLRVSGQCHNVHWCDLIKAPCGMFPPKAVPSAWEPQCWRKRELLT